MSTVLRRSLYASVLAARVVGVGASNGPEVLADRDLAEALALGQTCRAPIVRVVDPRGDIGAYVESPFARAALLAAAATMMHQPIEGSALRARLRPGYRVWLHPERVGVNQPSVLRVGVRHGSRVLAPTSIGDENLWVGRAPSHGIVDALRTRFPEYTFESLPPDGYDIVVDTDAGVRRYHVDARHREPMRVCNSTGS